MSRRNSNIIPSFPILLVTAALVVTGLICAPGLNIQYSPSSPERTIEVSFSYPGASARVVEAEATSLLEGALSNIQSLSRISSTSRDGGGSVYLTIREGQEIQASRFEVATVIRNVFTEMPSGVSFPDISINSKGYSSRESLVFAIRGDMASKDICRYLEQSVAPVISNIEGVVDLDINGYVPYLFHVVYDETKASSCGIEPNDIERAFVNSYSSSDLGLFESDGNVFSVRCNMGSAISLGDIPVKKVSGRVVHLSDIATICYEPEEPDSYYRINGLTTVFLSVKISSDVNLVRTAKAVKASMDVISDGLPPAMTITVDYDSSEYVSSELRRIYLRTALCIGLLLLFTFIIYRSLKYTLAISLTLLVDIIIAFVFYRICGLKIHIYTLAGITVSMGIIVDTAIVMADHYVKSRDRSIMSAIICATLTTVAALLVVLFLPERTKENLKDFAFVISINLVVSLISAWLFVPAIVDTLKLEIPKHCSFKRLRLNACIRQKYKGYIQWGSCHRWLYILVLVLAFGIPTCLIPDASKYESSAFATKWYELPFEALSKWPIYNNNRSTIDAVMSSSYGVFHRAASRSNFFRTPSKEILYISAGMPEGCSVSQLNRIIACMENYLSSFSEIDTYVTRINSPSDATIIVSFKREFEGTSFPIELKSQVTSMAMNFGGATWRISGIDDSYFNNNVAMAFQPYSIILTGYNYDELICYSNMLLDYLENNPRIKDLELWGDMGWYSGSPKSEYTIEYEKDVLAVCGTNPYVYYNAVGSSLFKRKLGTILKDGTNTSVCMESSEADLYDLWHINNMAVQADSTKMKLSSAGKILKRRTGLEINRIDQSYVIYVRYDFIGSHSSEIKVAEDAVDYMNGVMPVGFKASSDSGTWFGEDKNRYARAILLVIFAIFIISSIFFESLTLPLAVVLTIPLSFIGSFLIYLFPSLSFDQGGFAALVMLSGVVVNSAIYFIYAWIIESARQRSTHSYARAFSRIAWPVFLTIISTILGLVPFLSDGPQEVFWFPFAITVIAGLFTSLVALVIFFPVFVVKNR